MKEKEVLAGVLAEYFKYYKYSEAILNIREELSKSELIKKNWDGIKMLIFKRKFEKNEPLYFLAIHANLSLDEDSDKEAYKCLDLFVKNIESEDTIVEY